VENKIPIRTDGMNNINTEINGCKTLNDSSIEVARMIREKLPQLWEQLTRNYSHSNGLWAVTEPNLLLAGGVASFIQS
jgi:hypothetical protein